MAGNGLSLCTSDVPVPVTPVFRSIAVQHLDPPASFGYTHAVVESRDRGEVADGEEKVLCFPPPSEETDDALFLVAEIYPFEPRRLKIEPMERSLVPVEQVQVPDPLPNTVMLPIAQQVPVQALLMAPLSPLSELASHEHQLLARMQVLEAQQET